LLYFLRGLISRLRLLGIVLAVNIFSCLVGAILSSCVPNSFILHLPNAGGLLEYGWDCLLSIAFEYFPLWIFRKRLAFRKLGVCVTVANVAGYIVIWVTVLVFDHSEWLSRHLNFIQ
jgi:hypothetical protein